MSYYHCCKFLRRTACAAFAIAFALSVCCVKPASAAEDTVKAAKTNDSSYIGSKGLAIVDATAPLAGGEPLHLIEPAAGMVDRDFVLPETPEKEVRQGIESEEIFDLILAVKRKRDHLSNAIIALQRGFEYYVPLYELSRLLKFPSALDLEQGRLSGKFFTSENSYSIDVRAGTYSVLGETAKLPEDAFIVRNAGRGFGDIYVTAELLNKIWPLRLEIDFSELAIEINTPRKLPYEKERERNRKQKLLEKGDTPEYDLIHVPSGYRTLGPQTFSVVDNLRWNGDEKELTNALSVTGRGDILGTSADYTANWLSDSSRAADLRNLRLKLTRRDYGDGKLLPLGLKLAQAGDIVMKPSPFVSRIFSGRGVFLSTQTNERKKTFDEITINGISEPGWEVEIYRGRELLDFAQVSENGEYRFDNVSLNYGRNEFRIVLYGPQGQIEERIEKYSIKRDLLAVGQTTIEGALIDRGEPLFNVEDRARVDQTSSQYLRVDRGINSWMSGFATATRTPFREKDKEYLTFGANLNLLGGAGQVELYKEINGGRAIDLRFARKIADVNTNFQTTFLSDFESQEAGFGDAAKTFEGKFRASKLFDLPFAGLNLGLNVRHIAYKDRLSDTLIGNQQTLSFDSFSVTNNLSTNFGGGDQKTSQGKLRLNTPLSSGWSLSTGLDYDVYPRKELDLSRATLRYSDRDKFSASLAVRQGIEDSSKRSLDFVTSYDFGTFLGSAQVDWAQGEGLDFVLRTNTIFGPTGEDQRYDATTDYKGSVTAFRAHLYEDLDFDGVFSVGDVPIEGGRIRVNQRRSPPSDADGYIEMLGAGSAGFVRLTLDQKSSIDPFLMPLKEGYSVILRPGTKPFINFPLYQTGAIDGTVSFHDEQPMPGVSVELLDAQGVVIKDTVTLFDGFYVFEFVKPGTYTVRLAPSHPVNVPPKTVTVSSEDLFAYGVDLILLEQASEGSVTDDSVVRDGGRVAHTNHALVADGTLKPAPTSSDGPFDAVVRAVRIGEYPYKVRFVLDLSAPAIYKVSSEDDRRIINIDLPKTAWDAGRECQLGAASMFKECGVFALPDGSGTRVRLVGKKPIEVFYNSKIPAENGLPDRVFIDFMRDK